MQTGNTKTGTLYMIFSVLFFTLVNSLVKYLDISVSSWTKAFYRCLFGLIALLLWIILKKKSITVKRIPLLIMRGIIGGIALGCTFWTLELKGLSVSVFYLNIYPMFAPIFSVIFFKEKFDTWFLLPLSIAFIGIYVLTDPLQSHISLGDITGIISGLAAGLAIASVRELRKTNNSEVIYLSFTFFAIPVSVLGIFILPHQTFRIPITSYPPFPVIWFSLIIIGISATVAQLFMTEAYLHLTTQRGSLIGLFQIPVSTAIAVIFFHEALTPAGIAGGTLIGIASILAIIRKRRK